MRPFRSLAAWFAEARRARRSGGTLPTYQQLLDDKVLRLSDGWVELPRGTEGRIPPDFIRRMNQAKQP